MRVRNKKTGEVAGLDNAIVCTSGGLLKNRAKHYDSLAELNAEWEDYEGPKEYWYIDDIGLTQEKEANGTWSDEYRREIGNYFETEEEAEKAVQKLKAWKRLKDKGFRFEGPSLIDQCIYYRLYDENDYLTADEFKKANDEFLKDLGLLFGGEE